MITNSSVSVKLALAGNTAYLVWPDYPDTILPFGGKQIICSSVDITIAL
jgi:hypothetical protein